MKDLRTFTTQQPAVMVQHPLYDNFGAIVSKEAARQHLNIAQAGKIILFFGFIRKYKGLDILLQAVQRLKSEIPDFKLLVAGEFYEDEKGYQELIDELGIRDQLILKTNFIADNEVKYYLCAADVLVQPYKNATQSGVTPLAYHFEKPMIVTNVGGLPALVPHGKSGLVCEPDPQSIMLAIKEFYELGEDHFIPHLRSEKLKYSWTNIVEAIITLSEQ
ncbi:glycosyltransferase [Niabella hibiscisoli]|uniref:glycosyltransferase n=1 Tax=Niabella hibiscisoli TaxID=1825928 RepID=UPI001F0DC186|nr:glycosyltransferase [Niabella hibiscisoli]MCH5721334.1 glycosyltransferase [Niabella hibiscisoli]